MADGDDLVWRAGGFTEPAGGSSGDDVSRYFTQQIARQAYDFLPLPEW